MFIHLKQLSLSNSYFDNDYTNLFLKALVFSSLNGGIFGPAYQNPSFVVNRIIVDFDKFFIKGF